MLLSYDDKKVRPEGIHPLRNGFPFIQTILGNYFIIIPYLNVVTTDCIHLHLLLFCAAAGKGSPPYPLNRSSPHVFNGKTNANTLYSLLHKGFRWLILSEPIFTRFHYLICATDSQCSSYSVPCTLARHRKGTELNPTTTTISPLYPISNSVAFAYPV